jgi:Cu+-exporting ATPase
MAQNVGHDQLVVIRIDGMHCHHCELTIQKALGRCVGVHEVEVDFNSGQASVLFNRDQVTVRQLMEAVNEAGYRASGFVERQDESNPT